MKTSRKPSRLLVALMCASLPLTALAAGSTSYPTNSSTSATDLSAKNITRVTDQSVDRALTAKDLIGKEIYDQNGDQVGKVVDVVLSTSRSNQLARGLSKNRTDSYSDNASASSSTDHDYSRSSAATATTTGSSMNSDNYASNDKYTSSSDTGSSSNSDWNRNNNMSGTGHQFARSSREPCAVISSGGFLGMGDDLVKVPVSQLNYDTGNKHVTIAASKKDLKNLTADTGDRYSYNN